MQQHDLKASTGTRIARRVGRGGKRGKTSGRGHKGQKSRAGRKIRPAERDIIKKLPKLRGHGQNRSRTVHSGRVKPASVSLAGLERVFTAGDRVDPKTLVGKGLVSRISGRVPTVKILATGTLSKRLIISGCTLSEAARVAVVSAGGEVL